VNSEEQKFEECEKKRMIEKKTATPMLVDNCPIN